MNWSRQRTSHAPSVMAAHRPVPAKASASIDGWTRFRAYVELTKPRISVLIVMVALAAFWLASRGEPEWWRMIATLIGVSTLAGGIFALNQYLERDVDALMRRTERRPLPMGTLEPRKAAWFGVILSTAALVFIAVEINVLSGLIALFTLASYLFVYTPLKRRTPLCTFLGALPGATPPLLGWAAARGELGVEAWILFAILFFWQFPHFLAIGILYREDYTRAGIRMLPAVEADGKLTGQHIVICTFMLVVASALPTISGLSGHLYLYGAVALGAFFLYAGIRTALRRTKWQARQLLLASVFYLPLLFGLMLLNAPTSQGTGEQIEVKVRSHSDSRQWVSWPLSVLVKED